MLVAIKSLQLILLVQFFDHATYKSYCAPSDFFQPGSCCVHVSVLLFFVDFFLCIHKNFPVFV